MTKLCVPILILMMTTGAHPQGLPRQPGEITPTPELLSKAKQIYRNNCGGQLGCTYHCRKNDWLIYACAYLNGALASVVTPSFRRPVVLRSTTISGDRTVIVDAAQSETSLACSVRSVSSSKRSRTIVSATPVMRS